MTAVQLCSPQWVTLQDALAFHEISLQQYGGRQGIRDLGLIESALAQPQQGFDGRLAHQFPFGTAAAYAFHIAKNHPFIDGNKRTALACCVVFLRMNGYDLLSTGTAAADALLDMVEGRSDKDRFAQWLIENCRERPRLEMRDFFAALTQESWVGFSRSAAAGGSEAEVHTTVDEASVHIPIIRMLELSGIHAREVGDAQAELKIKGQIMALVTLFRIAEDMGYEW